MAKGMCCKVQHAPKFTAAKSPHAFFAQHDPTGSPQFPHGYQHLVFPNDFPPQFIVAGVRFSRVFAPGLSYYRTVRSSCSRGETLCQRREVRRCWARAGSYTCRRRGSGPTPCSRASILIPAAFRNWPGASGSTAFCSR